MMSIPYKRGNCEGSRRQKIIDDTGEIQNRSKWMTCTIDFYGKMLKSQKLQRPNKELQSKNVLSLSLRADFWFCKKNRTTSVITFIKTIWCMVSGCMISWSSFSLSFLKRGWRRHSFFVVNIFRKNKCWQNGLGSIVFVRSQLIDWIKTNRSFRNRQSVVSVFIRRDKHQRRVMSKKEFWLIK